MGASSGALRPRGLPEAARPYRQIAALKSQVADLSGQLIAVRQQLAAASVASPPKAELEVTDGAKNFSRPYGSLEECQAAQRATLAENDRRKAVMDAYNAAQAEKIRNGGGGFTQSDIIHVDAYCIPRN